MSKDELIEKFIEMGISESVYSFQGGLPSERYCMEEGTQWEVYYSERGLKNSLRIFDTEDAACEYMYNIIAKDSTTRVHGDGV